MSSPSPPPHDYVLVTSQLTILYTEIRASFLPRQKDPLSLGCTRKSCWPERALSTHNPCLAYSQMAHSTDQTDHPEFLCHFYECWPTRLCCVESGEVFNIPQNDIHTLMFCLQQLNLTYSPLTMTGNNTVNTCPP